MRNRTSPFSVGAYVTLGDAMRNLMETGEFEMDVKDFSEQYDYDSGKKIPDDLFESGRDLVRDSDFGDPSDSADEYTGVYNRDNDPGAPGAPGAPAPVEPAPADPGAPGTPAPGAPAPADPAPADPAE